MRYILLYILLAGFVCLNTIDAFARTVRVGIYQNEPKVFLNDQGKPDGFFVEIIEQVAELENWSLEYVPADWSDCLHALEAGRIDLMPDVAYSPERAELYHFHSTPVVQSWSRIYSRPDLSIKRLHDLSGLRVAVLSGSIQEVEFARMVKGFGVDLELISANSMATAFELVAANQTDAAVVNNFFGDYFCGDYGLEPTAVMLNAVMLYFVTARAENSALLAAIDKYMNQWISEPRSVYYKALSRWMSKDEPSHSYLIFYGVLGLLLALLLIVFYMMCVLRRRMRRKAKSLENARMSLHEMNERFRLLAETAPVGIVISTTDGKTIYVNRHFVDLFGYTLEEMPDVEAWWLLAYPDSELRSKVQASWVAALKEAKRTGLPCKPIEYPVHCRDGSVCEIEFRMGVKNNLLFIILTDVTERRRIEQQLVQAQKMESVGRLAGGVAHDFNNLLMGIMNYTEFCREAVGNDHPIREWLDEITRESERSAALTRQLLAFARKQTIAPRMLDLNDAVEGILKMLRRLIGEDVDLSWQPGSGLWSIRMDPGQVDQILANLCVNARDAIGGVGKVMIETANRSFDESYCSMHDGFCSGDYVMLAVSDDGCGMNRETLEHIFETFFTTKKCGEGTGLGLATLYGIIKQNNGFINVYSEPEGGTTFCLYLPRAEGIKTQTNKPVEESIQGGTETILLVEDAKSVRFTTKVFLEKLGYRVLEAASPFQALELASDNTEVIDMLITDVVMPGMNGRELADKLIEGASALKVLFMSGYTADVIAHRGILDSGMHFISKPFNRNVLGLKVREVLDSDNTA